MKDDESRVANIIISKDCFDDNQPAMNQDAAPKFYIGESEEIKEIIEMKGRHESRFTKTGKEEEKNQKSQPEIEGREQEPGTGVGERSSVRREKLKHNKTMMEEITEKVEEIPGTHPEKEELEMVVKYLKNHFVFGSMSTEALYNFHFLLDLPNYLHVIFLISRKLLNQFHIPFVLKICFESIILLLLLNNFFLF